MDKMQLPATFGKYELEELLGGGMTKVYRARDLVIGRTVAVKILDQARAADGEAKARFLREARTAGNIVHENIIQVYEYGEEQGCPYMVMEFLRGEDLRQAIQNRRTGDLKNRLRIALGLARALEHIHSHAITHRDIKPENVNITQDGKVKLMDFGIAKSSDSHLTRVGFTLGTPSYMAPEQVRGQQVTALMDVYAFGLVLFELMTGSKAILGSNISEVFQNILYEPVDLTPLQEAGAGRAVVDLVRRCVAKDPAERIQSMREVREALEAHLESDGTMELKAKTHRLIFLVAAAVTAILAVFYIVTGRTGQKAVQPTASPPGMALISAGRFPFGLAATPVDMPAFYIDRTEVTNSEYERFARATGRRFPIGDPREPVTDVAIDDARTYAAWVGKRLPTAKEWEKAARGPEGLLYPWGNQHDPGRAGVSDNPTLPSRRKTPVGVLSEDVSPYGVLNMAGNVRELVIDFATPSAEQVRAFALLLSPAPSAAESWCRVRGGSYDKPLPKNVNCESMLVPVRYISETIGFRCASDAH